MVSFTKPVVQLLQHTASLLRRVRSCRRMVASCKGMTHLAHKHARVFVEGNHIVHEACGENHFIKHRHTATDHARVTPTQ